MRGSSCPGSQFIASPMERNSARMNSANRRKWDEWSKLKQKTLCWVFQTQGEQENSIYPLSHRNLWNIKDIHTCICGGKIKAQSTEHTHSILATHPELDGTGLECLSYATLHFNSRTGQRVFMIRPRSLAEEKQVCIGFT